MNGASSHAAVQDVANDGNLQSLEAFFVPLDGVGVEQGLRRMLMHTVAGINYGDVKVSGHQVRSARIGMAHDNNISSNRAQRISRIQQRLSLLDARATREHEDSGCSQRFGSNFEGCPGAG